jgi:hypothetical protein
MNQPAVDAFDPLAIIGVLNRHQVSFAVIRGIAAGVQGAIRATTDLDIAYACDTTDVRVSDLDSLRRMAIYSTLLAGVLAVPSTLAFYGASASPRRLGSPSSRLISDSL